MISKDFLPNTGIICVAIDDVEVSPLRSVLSHLFEKELGVATVRSNPQGRARKGFLSPAHEYALFYGRQDASPGTLPKTEKQKKSYPHKDEKGRFMWDNLIRRPPDDNREDSPTMFYPIYVKPDDTFRIPRMRWDATNRSYEILEKPLDDEESIFPIKNGIEKRWRHGWDTVSKEKDEYRVRRDDNILIEYKSRMQERAVPKTWWAEKTYAAAHYGTTALEDIMGNGSFNFPKSVYLVSDCLLACGMISDGTVLDYFAGSGTTGHAVFNLNKTDNGNRKFILVEMGDYFEKTLKERIRRVMFSENWKNGKPDKKKIDGTVGIIKYQRLEQYEDVLNNLTTTKQIDDGQVEYPVRYLYRPEEQEIRLMMDMREPFSNRITYDKDNTEGFVDVLETYCYMKGLSIQRRLRFDFDDQVYRVIRSDKRVVVFRNVTEGVDDTDNLLKILNDERIKGVTQMDVNYNVNKISLGEGSDLKKIHTITTEDFDSGSVWDTIET